MRRSLRGGRGEHSAARRRGRTGRAPQRHAAGRGYRNGARAWCAAPSGPSKPDAGPRAEGGYDERSTCGCAGIVGGTTRRLRTGSGACVRPALLWRRATRPSCSARGAPGDGLRCAAACAPVCHWLVFRVRGLVTQVFCRVPVWTAAVARTEAYGNGSVGKERVLACLLSTFCSNDQVLILGTRAAMATPLLDAGLCYPRPRPSFATLTSQV